RSKAEARVAGPPRKERLGSHPRPTTIRRRPAGRIGGRPDSNKARAKAKRAKKKASSENRMRIPRLAVHRPVTMFMISLVVMLLGGISLTRLPVDLMPESEFPSITVRVNYSGVGPLEMEELVTRPLEQAVSAIAGLEQVNSTSSEGNSNVRLQFAWGTDLNEAADEVRTRVDRVRGRIREDAAAPTVFKF